MADGFTDTPERGGHGQAGHVPVLLKEAIDFLAVRRGGTYLDATVGLGGHSYEIAKRLGAPGHLIGLDKDPAALEIARERLKAGSSPVATPRFRNDKDLGDWPEKDRREKDWPEITLLNRSFAEIAKGQKAA
ncbi:MAG: 16S rRNA (cytosine(1402)-N(4))-methyltransferase, partial [Terriglobales bacterium]